MNRWVCVLLAASLWWGFWGVAIGYELRKRVPCQVSGGGKP